MCYYCKVLVIEGLRDTITYGYNNLDFLTSVTDANGTTSYTYDSMNGMTQVTLWNGQSIDYSYDLSGNVTGITTAFGTTSYTYDLLGRISSATSEDDISVSYTYDAIGNVATVTYSNGLVTTYTYDSCNRLILQVTKTALGDETASYAYTYGKAGEVLSVTESNRSVTYAYDACYRLVEENVTNADGTGSQTTYTYDANSNRLTKTADGVVTSYSYNDYNQLTSETTEGITKNYTYDANGNRIRIQDDVNGNTEYEYDCRNRLLAATVYRDGMAIHETYTYDYAGNRISKTTDGVTTNYLVNPNGALAMVLAEYDANGTCTAEYLRANGLVSRKRTDGISFYLTDGGGSVRMLADEHETITDTYTYDAFGVLISSTGTTANEFRYRGEQCDTSTGNYYLRARYMDPSTGTFISSDSYSGSTGNPISLHKYLYANANPVSYSDPSGYISLMEGMLAVGMMSVMYNSISSMLNVYQAGGSDEQAWTAYLDTLINGVAILGVYGCLGTVAVSYIWARAMLSVLDFVFASISLYEAHLAFIEGEIAAGVALTALGLLGMYSSYSNAMWAMQGVTANAASVAATAEGGSSGNRSVSDPLENHNTTVGRTGSLKAEGTPNSSVDLYNKNGELLQRRFYGEDGRATLDVDFLHGDGDGTHTFPHTHIWDWTQIRPRQ